MRRENKREEKILRLKQVISEHRKINLSNTQGNSNNSSLFIDVNKKLYNINNIKNDSMNGDEIASNLNCASNKSIENIKQEIQADVDDTEENFNVNINCRSYDFNSKIKDFNSQSENGWRSKITLPNSNNLSRKLQSANKVEIKKEDEEFLNLNFCETLEFISDSPLPLSIFKNKYGNFLVPETEEERMKMRIDLTKSKKNGKIQEKMCFYKDYFGFDEDDSLSQIIEEEGEMSVLDSSFINSNLISSTPISFNYEEKKIHFQKNNIKTFLLFLNF